MSLSEIHHPVFASSVIAKLPCAATDWRLPDGILDPKTVSSIDFRGLAAHSLFTAATTSTASVLLCRKGTQWP